MEGTNEEEMAVMTDRNKQKGKLHMDIVIKMLWPHKEYAAFVGEDISLVGNLW